MKLFLKDRVLKLITFSAIIVYIITALNSNGFYHADEHYQIVEFAGLKFRTHSPDELAWEFKAQIRPTLQPTICFILFKTFNTLNIKDPYSQTFLLRLLSAILALCAISYFILSTRNQFITGNIRIVYYLLSFFLWFIPVISVRFSSETWSGIFFLTALAYFLSHSKSTFKPYIIGVLFGISFLFRFQIAFAMVGFGMWLILIDRAKLSFLIKISFSFIVIMFLGTLLDWWFYGEFVFTPWNYFERTVLSGNEMNFGTSPWYFYLSKLITYPGYFIGIPLVLSLIAVLVTKPKHLLIWCIIPFIFFHSVIYHKEERFLFPIVFLFPLLLIEGYLVLTRLFGNHYYLKILNFLLLIIFIFSNTIGLIAIGSKSAGIGRMGITKFIHENYGDKPINLIYCSWANPYNPWHGLPMKFYLEKNMIDKRIQNLCELSDSLIINGSVNLLVIREYDLEYTDCNNIIENENFHFVKQSIPVWIEKVNTFYNGFQNQEILELYVYNINN